MDSTPVLSSDGTLIYTVSHFSVLDTIKSDVPFTRGQTLTAYRLGGEVGDGTDKLRIETPDMAAFEPRRTYLLSLTRDKSASVPQYALPLNLTIAVMDGKVFPGLGTICLADRMARLPLRHHVHEHQEHLCEGREAPTGLQPDVAAPRNLPEPTHHRTGRFVQCSGWAWLQAARTLLRPACASRSSMRSARQPCSLSASSPTRQAPSVETSSARRPRGISRLVLSRRNPR
jgi:hypothetical protein